MNKALIILDIQNDYFHNGSMELVGSEQASVNAKAIIDRFREEKLPVIFIQHICKCY
ncbi:MAG: isochorismatase family protein [Bacteroidetes bacterium]|nr:isochorismatase family protein [Bacteroidota bacterium]